MNAVRVDVAVIGGGLGGVAAALAACDAGVRVALVEPCAWLGGQVTSQGVSALDEHTHIETFGGTAAYNAFREGVRAHYQQVYGAPARVPSSVLGPDMPLNPGNGWVSRLCFLPEVGVRVLTAMLAPHVAAGRLTVLTGTTVVSAGHDPATGAVASVLCHSMDGTRVVVQARVFLDATEQGDLWPLVGTPFVTGAEAFSDTGEDGAPAEARPHEVQAITWCLLAEYCPGEHHVIDVPPGYAHFRESQPYTLAPLGHDGRAVVHHMFREGPSGTLPFWTYRRVHDGALLGGRDVALINWVSQDYYARPWLTAAADEAAQAYDEARRVSLGFLHWLQTACPRDDGGNGYPELRLVTDALGTTDGLAQAPYVREARRIVARRRVVAQDIAAAHSPGPFAPHMADAVGVGWYALDLHPCVGNARAGRYTPTWPFQIPLGALVPAAGPGNVLAAGKSLGVTHITNGAYRLHPVEWAVGEAAGVFAARLAHTGHGTHAAYDDAASVRAVQAALVARGAPVCWTLDDPPGTPGFARAQHARLDDGWHTQDVISKGGKR